MEFPCRMIRHNQTRQLNNSVRHDLQNRRYYIEEIIFLLTITRHFAEDNIASEIA